MYNFLVHAHSGFRWILLVLVVGAIILAVQGLSGKRPFSGAVRRWSLFAMAAAHLQLVIGFILYFISPVVQWHSNTMSDSTLRFFAVEHLSTMLIAVILITIGYSKAKRRPADRGKFKAVFWFYLIGLFLMLAGIPWPFRGYGTGWF